MKDEQMGQVYRDEEKKGVNDYNTNKLASGNTPRGEEEETRKEIRIRDGRATCIRATEERPCKDLKGVEDKGNLEVGGKREDRVQPRNAEPGRQWDLTWTMVRRNQTRMTGKTAPEIPQTVRKEFIEKEKKISGTRDQGDLKNKRSIDSWMTEEEAAERDQNKVKEGRQLASTVNEAREGNGGSQARGPIITQRNGPRNETGRV